MSQRLRERFCSATRTARGTPGRNHGHVFAPPQWDVAWERVTFSVGGIHEVCIVKTEWCDSSGSQWTILQAWWAAVFSYLYHMGYLKMSCIKYLEATFCESFLQEALVSSSGMDRDVHSLMLSIQYCFSANHFVAHPPRYPEGWFWRGCRDVWHARAMQVSLSWRLPE